MAAKLGIDSVLYYNTATYGSPTWTPITCVRDLVLNFSWDTVEAPSRASRVKTMAKTIVDISASGTLKVSDTDTTYIAVWEKLISGTGNLDVMILNGVSTVTGVRGVRFDALVTQGNEDQGIGNALYLDVNFMPDAFSANAVKTAVVTAGAPVFTSLAA
jgi:hypothetical protein